MARATGRNNHYVGERVGSRVIIAEHESSTPKYRRFLIRCDCGREQITSGVSFRASKACKKCNTGGALRKYGDRTIVGVAIYRSWTSMRRRCNQAAINVRTMRWAGRGIKVCSEWNNFPVFEAWSLANGYRPGLSLDRIDSDGDYEPGNCQWVTRSENSKRCRAQYHFIRRATPFAPPYDEPCYGDA